jgi:hypothetical protein
MGHNYKQNFGAGRDVRFTPKGDVAQHDRDVRFVPIADIDD